MRATRPITLIGFLAIGSGAFAQQNVDELKQRRLAQPQSMSAEDFARPQLRRCRNAPSRALDQLKPQPRRK